MTTKIIEAIFIEDTTTRDWYAKKIPVEGEMLCPYDNIPYNQVPGYVSGYGCPYCKAISFYHLPVSATNTALDHDKNSETEK